MRCGRFDVTGRCKCGSRNAQVEVNEMDRERIPGICSSVLMEVVRNDGVETSRQSSGQRIKMTRLRRD